MKPATKGKLTLVVSLLLGLVVMVFGAVPGWATQYAYVTNPGSNTVSVMDTTSKIIVATIPVGEHPAGMAITPDGTFAYVANFYSHTVSVIDMASNVVSTTIAVGLNPQHVAITPDGAFAYVTNDGSNTVSVIDTGSNTVVTTLGVGVNPALVAITPDGAFAYVTNFGSDTVSVIATATNTIVATIPVGSQPQCLVITPDGAFVYVENRLSNTLMVIATANNRVVATIPLPVGSYPNGMAITPNGAFVYVSEYGLGIVSIIDTAINTVVGAITVGYLPCGIAITPDGAWGYVANSGANTVSVVDMASNTVVATVNVGSYPTWISITPTILPTQPVQFVPVTPCRLVDTRINHDPIPGGTSRSFAVPQLGGCGIPATAGAYSLNVTIVPHGSLGFLTVWPTGKQRPVVSTINSLDGRIKANAAIVVAGRNGAVSVFVTQTTDVILDIDGYFAPATQYTLAFYPMTPCRVLDTRKPNGDLGGPYLQSGHERDFPALESTCNIPSSAQAYSMNFTAVPYNGQPLGYLTVWPTGETQPVVSTLNNLTGTIVANAAIIPAGGGGDFAVYASGNTHLVADIDGYFAAPGPGGLFLYPVTPCRVIDTRHVGNGQPFTGAVTVDIVGSACAPSVNAQAFVFNATVVPSGVLGYLTLWPHGQDRPVVSTLNAPDAAITSNMAIVPTTNGSIDAYAAGLTQMIFDLSGYFAP